MAAECCFPVCGTRLFPCRERLRHLPTTAHTAPSLYLPQAALGLAAKFSLASPVQRYQQQKISRPIGVD